MLIRFQLMEDQDDRSDNIVLTIVTPYNIGSTKTGENP